MLDHVVLATPDISATSAEIAEATGVVPSPGGPHVDRGTRNDLCAFPDGSYLEIIGPDPDQVDPAHPRPFGVDRLTAAGMVTWCARTDDLSGLITRAARAGLAMEGPEPMQRDAPEGRLRWELALPGFDTLAGLVPFFIDWGDSPHPSSTAAEGLTLSAFEGAARDPEAARRILDTLGEKLPVQVDEPEGITITLSGPAGALTVGPAVFD